MRLLKTHWFWLWAPTTTIVLVLVLASDFVLAGIGWLDWGVAAIIAPILVALTGMGLGWFNPRRSWEDLWLIAWVAAGCLFLLVVLQYLAAIIFLPACDTPQSVASCFDDHSAAVGGFGALGGSALMAVLVGLGSGAGAAFRQWLARQ